MENKDNHSVARRFWRIVRIVCYMLRKGLSKRKLVTEFQLLRKISKIAGKAISGLLSNTKDPFRHHNYYTTGGAGASFSCRSVEPEISYFSPQEVQFSCSTTPSYPLFLTKRKRKETKATEIVDFSPEAVVHAGNVVESAELDEIEHHVDREAEEFIRRFYEQLRLQTVPPVTKSYHRRHDMYG